MAPPQPPPVNLDDYQAQARARLPKMVWDYYAGGAEDEATLAENRDAWRRWRLRPRMLVDVSGLDTATRVLGTPIALPVLLAPCALQRLAHPDGEAGMARAAAAAGTIAVVSTTASQSLEEVAAASDGPRWFQLYAVRDRAVTADLIQRAEAAGYQALCLTIDTPRLGRRERDLRNGFRLPPDIAIANLEPYGNGRADYDADRKDDSLTWEVLAWLRSHTRLPVVVKGVLTAEDARLACEHGVDALIVSNHGGRQLDGVVATAEALPEIVDAVDGRVEVLVDGGIRRGTDVVKALALGAQAVLVGRPVLWGLAVDGEAGVGGVLRLLHGEIARAMALCGAPTTADLDRAHLG